MKNHGAATIIRGVLALAGLALLAVAPPAYQWIGGVLIVAQLMHRWIEDWRE